MFVIPCDTNFELAYLIRQIFLLHLKIQTIVVKLKLFIGLLCVSCWAQNPTYDPVEPGEAYNFVLGTQTIGGKYNFGSKSALIDQVKHTRGMGSNILKISLGKNAFKSYRLPPKEANTTQKKITKIAALQFIEECKIKVTNKRRVFKCRKRDMPSLAGRNCSKTLPFVFTVQIYDI